MSDISTKNAALETMAAEYNSATQWFVKLRRKRLPPLSIRLTETERAELKAAADGQSLNSYIKDQLFGRFWQGRAFVALEACVTAFGVVSPLPGAPMILRPCGAEESFLPASRLQVFERTAKGRLRLAGTELCLSAGMDAARTFSATHRWRTLTMEHCAGVPLSLSVWE